ncbi:MAG: hypothetical protein K0R41_1109 [Geminicoccaceae bacterium]|nr:hypothetical protein [Geminicoccaceae bacterium]
MTQPARLTSALLARKGQAFPTGGVAGATIDACQPLPPPDRLTARAGMALVSDRGGVRPARQAKGTGRGPGNGDDGRVALTLRLDRERHRRLRIFGARHERTSQEVILKALDAYLAACGADCACLRDAAEGCAN